MDYFEEHVPAPLLELGPRGIKLWQWIATPGLILLALAVGYVLGRLTQAFLLRLARRTSMSWDDVVVGEVGSPLVLAWAAIVTRAFAPWLLLPDGTEASVIKAVELVLYFAFFWFLYRLVKVGADLITRSTWSASHPAAKAFVPLGARIARIAVVGIAVVALLAQLGYPVASLVAGLGIGGLAVALAAKPTLENLFGAFALGTDQPFRVGDFIKAESILGTVELIGFRSTRIRTLDRTLVTVPNGKLADMQIESFAVRDRFRLAVVLNLVYGTTAAQMREVIAGCEALLRAHPQIWPDDVVVRFFALGTHSLDVEVMAWFLTKDWAEFRTVRQEILLGFMEIVERAGTAFAFPTRTIHVVRGDEPRVS